MPDMKRLGPVVRALRKNQNLTLEAVALEADHDSGNLSKFERGLQGIEDETLAKIAKALNTTTSELLRRAADAEDLEAATSAKEMEPHVSGIGPRVNPKMPGLLQNVTTTYAPDLKAVREIVKVPVFREQHLQALADNPSSAHSIPADEHVPALSDASQFDFAWRVTDDSMTAPAGEAVSYPGNSMAYFDPKLAPKSGDAVLVKLGPNSFAFTRLVSVNGVWVMSPLNPRYPHKELPFNAQIVAVAYACMSIFRPRLT